MTANFKTIQFVARFVLRMVVLCAFALFGHLGFGRSFAALLLLSVVFSVVAGLTRQERLFDDTLTYWDEAAVYGLLYALTVTINQAAAA
ncbi:MAG TPA: hypothetical protein VE267_02025 [Bradyrhizobium sp.]|nr:hypothetical protein [Bradyrhizobium sp.]